MPKEAKHQILSTLAYCISRSDPIFRPLLNPVFVFLLLSLSMFLMASPLGICTTATTSSSSSLLLEIEPLYCCYMFKTDPPTPCTCSAVIWSVHVSIQNNNKTRKWWFPISKLPFCNGFGWISKAFVISPTTYSRPGLNMQHSYPTLCNSVANCKIIESCLCVTKREYIEFN